MVAERKSQTLRAVTRDLDAVLRDLTGSPARDPLVAVLTRLRSALDGLEEALDEERERTDDEYQRRLGLVEDLDEALADKGVMTGEELDTALAAVSVDHTALDLAPGRCSCGAVYATSDAYGSGEQEFRVHVARSALDRVPPEALTVEDLLAGVTAADL